MDNTFIKDRVQVFNPKTKEWVKLDTSTGRAIKSKAGKWKNVRIREVSEKNSPEPPTKQTITANLEQLVEDIAALAYDTELSASVLCSHSKDTDYANAFRKDMRKLNAAVARYFSLLKQYTEPTEDITA